jgi:hypothetical protein
VLIFIFSGCAQPPPVGDDNQRTTALNMSAVMQSSNFPPLTPSEVKPSRQSVYFNTLEIPKMILSTKDTVPTEVVDTLQESLIQATRNTKLFIRVLSDAPYESGGGGVLSVRGTILNWTDDGTTAWVNIHVALIAKGIGDHFAESTAAGTITRDATAGHQSNGTEPPYEVQPLVEGISTFISTFMDPL